MFLVIQTPQQARQQRPGEPTGCSITGLPIHATSSAERPPTPSYPDSPSERPGARVTALDGPGRFQTPRALLRVSGGIVGCGRANAHPATAGTRQDRDHQPPGGWYPHQAMTREAALRTYTIWAAYAEFAEEIWKIQVLKTVIAGQTVFPAKP